MTEIETEDAPAPHPGGRPTKYDDKYAEQSYKLALLGATDEELADFFEVHVDTIYEWKKVHPEFSEAVHAGKRMADAEIAHSLYDRAKGATWEEEQAFKVKVSQFKEEVQIVTVRRAAPPDTQAASLWLRNRQPEKWREKVINEHTGLDGGPISTVTHARNMSDSELDARINELSDKTEQD